MGFVSRHFERDLKIPKHRQDLINSIEKDLLNDDDVLGVFYGGSIGNDNTDLYSDIDLRIVVSPEKFQEFILNKKERLKRWGNVVYFEDLGPDVTYSIAHYDCFIKIDTFYYKFEDIKPSVWLQNIKIVRDLDGQLEDTLNKSTSLSYKPSREEIEFWRTKFFAHFHEAYRRAMRKELYYALKCIDSLRLSMITGWYMEVGIQPNAFGDWAKYEGERSKLIDWQLSLLDSWECGRDVSEIINVMKSIVPEFKRVHLNICNKFGIEERTEWVDEIVHMAI
ncbi:aminoglycoside 6-adenylyltransferase [Gracilibacillus lacisalsi]|uniref:aminoglycoside 6-adenylyltransferase n=1 Tax=Gracilibacillus lacisalsi TaxID=393087 RepID=UPI00036EF4EE|nr:aminoglycoside 6-adenylyltransferase [Gracilibacillus lacisalsi]